jgi:formate-dependent phosphoribosylglycinamide formyltransferase (GAR transformylase)
MAEKVTEALGGAGLLVLNFPDDGVYFSELLLAHMIPEW